MSKSLPPPRRHAQYRAAMGTPPLTPPIVVPPDPPSLGPGPPSATGSSASMSTSGVDGISAADMESHLAVLEGIGPPGATRRPTRRVRSIERTWAWVKSRSSMYGEAAFGLDPTDEEGSPHGSPHPFETGPTRPLTIVGHPTPLQAIPPERPRSDIDPEERRRRRQGVMPESTGLRPPPRPRPQSRAMTSPAAPINTSVGSSRRPWNMNNSMTTMSSPTQMSPASSRSASRADGIPSPSSSSHHGPQRVPVQSINDIVRRHSSAVHLAEETAKDRARAELASCPDNQPSTPSTPRTPIGTSPPTKMSPTPTKAMATAPGPPRKAFQSPTPASTHTPSPPRNAFDTPTKVPGRARAPTPPPKSSLTPTKPTVTAPTPPKASPSVSTPPTAPGSNPRGVPARATHRRQMSSRSTAPSLDSSDRDSVLRDFHLAQAAFEQLTPKPTPAPTPPAKAHMTPYPGTAFPSTRTVLSPTPEQSPRNPHHYRDRSNQSPDLDSLHRQRSTASLLRPKSSSPLPPDDDAHAMALYLRSPQLNRVVHLPRTYPERSLQVSLADLGKPDGKPVVVFLGLGCVRYLVALYDDLARALGLRLICIDRWGLGKTDQVPQDQRGLLDWADVVRRVLDELGVERFQIVAHSAGAPYALACVLKMERRVRGKIHLLSPWVGGDVPEGYKWLKWVPNGVIKSALAAEWRLESYFLGKAPTVKNNGKHLKNSQGMASSTSLDTDDVRSRSSLNVESRPESRAGVPLESGEGFDSFASDMYSNLPQSWSAAAPLQVSSISSSPAFPHALMQASHAESLSGTTADLLSVVLGRDAKPWGFSYTDIHHPCKIWYGADDERVSEKSMRWMERAMDAELIVVPEEGHNLMSSRVVMFDVLDSLADDMS